MLTAVIVLSTIVIVAGYIVWNLLRKVERLEDISANLGSYVEAVSELITKSNERIQEIDKNGTFQSDDEVGFFFQNLKEIQDILNSANVDEPRTTNNQGEEEERS